MWFCGRLLRDGHLETGEFPGIRCSGNGQRDGICSIAVVVDRDTGGGAGSVATHGEDVRPHTQDGADFNNDTHGSIDRIPVADEREGHVAAVGGGGDAGAAVSTGGAYGVVGTVNTGGGAGGNAGGSALPNGGSAGGSGVVVIRYPDSYAAASSTTGSPTVTVASGYRVYKWTGNGSITF